MKRSKYVKFCQKFGVIFSELCMLFSRFFTDSESSFPFLSNDAILDVESRCRCENALPEVIAILTASSYFAGVLCEKEK